MDVSKLKSKPILWKKPKSVNLLKTPRWLVLHPGSVDGVNYDGKLSLVNEIGYQAGSRINSQGESEVLLWFPTNEKKTKGHIAVFNIDNKEAEKVKYV